MNIYKRKYRQIKEKLRTFGERIKQTGYEDRSTAEFWKKMGEKYIDPWENVITKYLAYSNNDIEREFIDGMFFRDLSVIEFCRKFYISQNVYYARRERILNDILFIATEYGLISTGIANAETAATGDTTDVTDEQWNEIEKLMIMKSQKSGGAVRRAVNGILFVKANGIPWRALPQRYGAWQTIYHKYVNWEKNGLWAQINVIVSG